MHFGFEEKHFKQIEPIFSKADNATILEKIGSLREYCMDNSSKITDITGYTVKALLNKFNCPTLFYNLQLPNALLWASILKPAIKKV